MKNDLSNFGIGVVDFFEVVPNPRHTMMDRGVEICNRENCDFVVDIGDGSVIDMAKAIAIAAVHMAAPPGTIPRGILSRTRCAGPPPK